MQRKRILILRSVSRAAFLLCYAWIHGVLSEAVQIWTADNFSDILEKEIKEVKNELSDQRHN